MSDKGHGNEEFQWDSFNPEWYCHHNYGKLRDDDRLILGQLAEFFGRFEKQPFKHGIDIGTGANLYPVLAMLPLCGDITLRERAERNYQWLRDEVKHYSPVWDTYWAELAGHPLYSRIRDPRWAVQDRAHVERGSIFDLPTREYDIGTMFFVAESITERHAEFARAADSFFGSLQHNAPFAAAFMRGSNGYYVDGVRFPAVAIDEGHVRKCVEAAGIRTFEIAPIDSDTPLREDVGMVLVTGTAAPRR